MCNTAMKQAFHQLTRKRFKLAAAKEIMKENQKLNVEYAGDATRLAREMRFSL